jgi:hypothetical protein
MNTTHRPAFSSPELQTALDKASAALEGADEARSRVSQDIKALESYLVGLRLTTPFRYPLGKTLVPDEEQYVAASLEASGSAGGKILEEAIVLGEDGHGRHVKPLIETKFEVRKHMYNRLADFITALGEHYAIDPNQLTDNGDDDEMIPF